MSVRLVCLLLISSAAASSQDGSRFFPFEAGDEWVYDVEGVASRTAPDTVDAVVRWRALEVRPGAVGDTLVFEVSRSHADGSSDTTMCSVVREPFGHLLLLGEYVQDATYDDGPCYSAGGFPLSGNTRPWLGNPVSRGTETVRVGPNEYTGEVAVARFVESGGGGPYVPFVLTDVISTMVEGIGQVELYAVFSRTGGQYTPQPQPERRDELRARLLSAVVGGVRYGDFRPVSVGDGPTSSALTVRVGPNPLRATGTAWITLGGARDANLSVLDALGRVVRSVSVAGDGAVAFDVAGLSPGVYVVTLTSGADWVVSPVVIAR